MKTTSPTGFLAIIILGVFVVSCVICAGLLSSGGGSSSLRSNSFSSSRSSSPQPSPTRNEWYSGGTLHKATVAEWNPASYANRLATCGDFMATMMQKDGKRISSMEALRSEAAALERCITEAGRGDHADTQSVATISALCYMLMDQ